MLLSFAVENFRSFKDERQLNLMRSSRDETPGFSHKDVVPAVAIFGPNASGKSNLLGAIETMFRLVRTSAVRAPSPLPYTPHLFDSMEEQPTKFHASIRLDDVRYDFGFTYTSEKIASEWLFSYPHGRQRVLYERDASRAEVWYFGDSLSGPNQTLAKATRPDALLISTAGLINHDALSPLFTQISTLVSDVGTENTNRLLQRTLERLLDDDRRTEIVEKLLRRADFGVQKLMIEEDPFSEEIRATGRRLIEVLAPEGILVDLPDDLERTALVASLMHVGANHQVKPLPFLSESVGTRNFLALLGPILDRLKNGGVLLIDEIDTSLHPRLVGELVRLFQSPKTNKKQAQLIFSTHDVTVMMNTGDYNVLRRDQIWFIEKHEGASELYSLMEFKPRENEVFSRNYLNDRYGALPSIDETAFSDIWSDEDVDV